MPSSSTSSTSRNRSSTAASSRRKPSAAPAAIHYRVEPADVHAHLFRVTLTIAEPATVQVVSLPVWIPGSYLVREFAKSLQKLQAHQGTRSHVTLTQLDKSTWQANCAPGKPLVLQYEVYANDNSVRTAMLDAQRGFFNGTSLCLRVHGREDGPHQLELPAPDARSAAAGWEVATGLAPVKVDRAGFGTYQAAGYDELVDCPVEMGRFWSGSFTARGVPHRFVVAGAAPTFDGERLLADTQKICETEIRFWHGNRKPPYASYLFMLNTVDDGYGGLEHRNSTALICSRRDLPRLGDTKTSEGYTTLRGLISHEYFHTWNVKRLRPAELARYDYSRENYTELLWFFEGFTSYYDDLLLRRAGLLDNTGYLKLLNKTINQVMQTPGRLVQSAAEASFDAWVKYYRQDENTANATVSYYTKGSLIALCFDLTLRGGATPATARGTLDDVMRALWLRCKAGPMTEADFAAELEAAAGRSFAEEIAAWVHGKGELPLKALLQQHGVAVLEDAAQLQHRLGLRTADAGGSVQIKAVLRGGVAEAAGFMAGDEWLGVEPLSPASPAARGKAMKAAPTDAAGWRLARLDDLLLYVAAGQKAVALVSRDRRLLRLELAVPPELTTWRLLAQDAALLNQWLEPSAAHAG